MLYSYLSPILLTGDLNRHLSASGSRWCDVEAGNRPWPAARGSQCMAVRPFPWRRRCTIRSATPPPPRRPGDATVDTDASRQGGPVVSPTRPLLLPWREGDYECASVYSETLLPLLPDCTTLKLHAAAPADRIAI